MFYFFASSFIRLADYLIVNTMHVLAVNSVSTLLNYLTEQLQNTPSLAQIQGLEEENQEEKAEEEKVNLKTWTQTKICYLTLLQLLT